jgi:hypothetical protein
MHGSDGYQSDSYLCMDGSGGVPTRYSFSVCMGQANTNQIVICVWMVRGGYRLDIHLVYAGVRRMTDQIFSDCRNGSGGLPIRYLLCV